jgi:hypothetical protein
MSRLTYSRTNPSSRYRELLDQYKQMHEKGDERTGKPAGVTFDGRSLRAQMQRIALLVQRTGSRTLLDYGCGKGKHHAELREICNVQLAGYDPAYPPFSHLPAPADGVVCTDVLEHCPAEDMEWIVAELFAHARRFVFASISCIAAQKFLPSGENAHVTIQSTEYWAGIFSNAWKSADRKVPFEAWAYHDAHTDRIANFPPLEMKRP